ncbi:MAG: hypothetical protein ACE5JQ_00785 [Candidatus Methylomirabilales bacterium]
MTTENERESSGPFLYRTENRGLAAALIASGFELVELKRANGLVFFTFRLSQMLEEEAAAYWEGMLTVSARRMKEALEYLSVLVEEPGSGDGADFDGRL